MILGFNAGMYAPEFDLILISNASRKVAHNINLCFSIYEKLMGKCANNAKYEVFFPGHFNKRLSSNISGILYFKVGAFPFTYLGILITPKKLAISQVSSILNKNSC